MDTPVLAVRHVSKSFAGARALVDIDLEIAPESTAWPGKTGRASPRSLRSFRACTPSNTGRSRLTAAISRA